MSYSLYTALIILFDPLLHPVTLPFHLIRLMVLTIVWMQLLHIRLIIPVVKTKTLHISEAL